MYGLKRGLHFWAPQYVCHKVMMGLLDMYLFANSSQALDILCGCACWFKHFTDDVSREVMSNMMDLEETGGMMELWGDLFAITGNADHLELMKRYERTRLTEPVLKGEDVLTNMHANMQIPEIHGCARAYEITGEERYRRIVENYWNLAVTMRGTFATGGQTDGEIWTPMNKQAARLSRINQEHCVVYNMVRLANYLFKWSGEAKYLDYIEQNIENGLMAQGFWKADSIDKDEYEHDPKEGIVAYNLPLAAGSIKQWGSRKKDFWCCHCTCVQANAKYREFVFYKNHNEIVIAQYIPCRTEFMIDNASVKIALEEQDTAGSYMEINNTAIKHRIGQFKNRCVAELKLKRKLGAL